MGSSTRLSLLFFCFAFVPLALSAPSLAQRMPNENVVDVPAIGDNLCVSNVFQSNMVLQRDKPTRIWGWAEPGKSVSVKIGERDATATAGEDRGWSVLLPPQPANSKPQTIIVQCENESLTLTNILIGDVWVLGGQSNMEFELAKVENGSLEIVSANYPEIRILTIPYGQGPEKRLSFPRLFEWSSWFGRHFRKGDWDVCTPSLARELSAIGFVFARRIHTASRGSHRRYRCLARRNDGRNLDTAPRATPNGQSHHPGTGFQI